METLPFELFYKILDNLSLRDIVRFKLTNKTNYELCNLLYKELQDYYNSLPVNIETLLCPSEFNPQFVNDTYNDVKRNINIYNKISSKVIFQHKRQEIEYNINLWEHNRIFQRKNVVQLTYEQNKIVEYEDINKKIIAIQAYAGTGKTTTMYHLSKKWSDKRILYLTFNNSLSNDTQQKFIDLKNVDVMTTHSLAYDYLQKNGKLENKVGKISRDFLRNICGIKSYKEQTNIIRKIEEFSSSSAKQIQDQIQNIWNDIFLHNSTITHDMYLKHFQLMKPKLDYDIIILDEAQDTTPCVLELVMRQKKTTRIIIGDIHQQIYDFRGVCNPFTAIKTVIDKHFYLTRSFRYGFDVCYLSSIMMKTFKNESKTIQTNNPTNTEIYYEEDITNLPKGVVILSRTNMEMFKNLKNISEHNTIHILGKKYNFLKEINIIKDFIHVSNGNINNVRTKKLLNFSSIQDIKEFFYLNANYKWIHRIKLYEEYSDSLIDIYERISTCIVEKEVADVVITNVHQSKGLEFDNVYLSDDFGKMIYTKSSHLTFCKKDVFNLLYVAITRAKKKLYINKTIYNFLCLYFSDYKYVTENNDDKECSYCNEITCLELTSFKYKIPFMKHDLEKYYKFSICKNCFESCI